MQNDNPRLQVNQAQFKGFSYTNKQYTAPSWHQLHHFYFTPWYIQSQWRHPVGDFMMWFYLNKYFTHTEIAAFSLLHIPHSDWHLTYGVCTLSVWLFLAKNLHSEVGPFNGRVSCLFLSSECLFSVTLSSLIYEDEDILELDYCSSSSICVNARINKAHLQPQIIRSLHSRNN